MMLQIREILVLGLFITCSTSNPPEHFMRPPRPSQNLNYNSRYNPHALAQPPQIQPEPSFMQRLVGWFNPFGGGNYNEAEDSVPVGTYNENIYTQSSNIAQVRDTEPTTRTTPRTVISGKIPVSKCSPCNQVPWIPMIPTYQLPILNPSGQTGPYPPSVYFKHQFGDQPYTQIPTQAPISSTTPLKLVNYPYPGQVIDEALQAPPSSGNAFKAQSYYQQPWTTQPTPASVTPLKLQSFNQQPWAVQPWTSPPPTPQKVQSYYKIPDWSTQSPPVTPIKQQQYPYSNSKYQQPTQHLTLQQQVHQQYQGNLHGNLQNQNTPYTSIPPQVVDPATISFTTNRPLNRNRQVAASSLTNQEYLPPPNVLPLESEGSQYQPIPIPNLSATPIPPLYNSKPFLSDPYFNEDTGFIKLVPLEPESQLSSKVNVQAQPNSLPSRYETFIENDSNSFNVYKSLQVEQFTTAPETVNTEKSFITSQPVFRVTDYNLAEESQTMTPILVEGNDLVTDTALAATEIENDEMEHRHENLIDDDKNEYLDTVAQESSRVIPIKPQRTHQRAELENEFEVKFEPSIQTTSDLSEEIQRKNRYAELKRSRERETPKEMLDIPIFHITQPTRQTTEAPPVFKPLLDYTKALSTLWTVKPRISSSTEAPPTPSSYTSQRTIVEQFTRRPTQDKDSGETQILDQRKFATKKPKQIQIIIPYTSYHKPSPFKTKEDQGEPITYKPIRGHYVTLAQKHEQKNEIQDEKVFNKKPLPSSMDSFNGHGYHNDQEYSDHGQESKIVESKVTQEPYTRNTKYLTKILATNIKELLKKEKTPKPQKHYARVDLIRLQKNIDGWTEQSFLNKASTIALRHHTKIIPREYLTTAFYRKPSPFSTSTMPTTYDPELMEDTKRQYSNILYKSVGEIVMNNPQTIKRNDVSRLLSHENEIHQINNNLTYTADSGVKIFVPKSTKPTLSPKELWNQIHLTVSPLTKEKIYVVTPLPFAHHDNRIHSFKSPRFSVRPSPGAQQKSRKYTKYPEYKPELLGKMENMVTHVETVDGHSRVIRIITPSEQRVTPEHTTPKSKS